MALTTEKEMGKGEVLERVKTFAASAHQGQKRKYTPEPYIVHPIRVMELCSQYTDDHCILSAALLHDVLEDTAVDQHELHGFLLEQMNEEDASRTLKLVVELTDVYVKKQFPRYNRRQRKEMERERIEKTSADSQTIKYADIIDNCREIVQYDPDFARVFLPECRAVLSKIPLGNPELHRLANEILEKNLGKIRRHSHS